MVIVIVKARIYNMEKTSSIVVLENYTIHAKE